MDIPAVFRVQRSGGALARIVLPGLYIHYRQCRVNVSAITWRLSIDTQSSPAYNPVAEKQYSISSAAKIEWLHFFSFSQEERQNLKTGGLYAGKTNGT
ncbi:MAG: hypothetical protein JXL20_05090 [Deltaproteobacteria bacterium]|nr:hypothetical protein [Deltaproteobacteria bacterium]